MKISTCAKFIKDEFAKMSTWEMQFFRLGEIITREDIYASGIKSLKSITLLKKIYQY